MTASIQTPVPPIAQTPKYLDSSTLSSGASWEVDSSTTDVRVASLISSKQSRSDSPEKQTMQDGCCSKHFVKPIKECCTLKRMAACACGCFACIITVATCTPAPTQF